MRFVKISATFATVKDLGCIPKRIFNSTGFSNKIFAKNTFPTTHLFSCYFLYNFMKLPQCLKLSQIVYKRAFYEHRL